MSLLLLWYVGISLAVMAVQSSSSDRISSIVGVSDDTNNTVVVIVILVLVVKIAVCYCG